MDGFQVLRHILAHIAVTPGGAPDKLAVHIFQCYRKTVDFRFYGKGSRGFLCQDFSQEVVQFLQAVGILKADERDRMYHLFKLCDCLATHPLGR